LAKNVGIFADEKKCPAGEAGKGKEHRLTGVKEVLPD
jgi:hypothetical protein